jgi:predicted DCC family thiol-disulfide oxidoreductase YuxK
MTRLNAPVTYSNAPVIPEAEGRRPEAIRDLAERVGPDASRGPGSEHCSRGGDAAAQQSDYLLYDGECPVCRAYVALSRLRRLHPGLRILDARAEPGLVADLRRTGYEIDEGMVLCLGGAIHFGADATRMIAVRGGTSPARWRRLALAAFGAAPWSARLYPWLNRARGVLLRLLRRGPIA